MMEFQTFTLECLGFSAGALVATSALKRAIDVGRDRKIAAGESLLRNSMQLLGNFLWLVYGVLAGRPALVLSALVACSILSYLVYHSLRVERE